MHYAEIPTDINTVHCVSVLIEIWFKYLPMSTSNSTVGYDVYRDCYNFGKFRMGEENLINKSKMWIEFCSVALGGLRGN